MSEQAPRRPVAVVTGAARRVGAAIAIELARAGFDLVLVTRRGGSSAERVVRSLEDAPSRAGGSSTIRLLEADLADPGSVLALCERLSTEPIVDALVHNAASYAPSPFGAVDDAAAITHFRTNAVAPLRITQALAPALRRSTLAGGGSVVCFGDIHVMGRPRRGYLAYGMSKAALGYLVEDLARELAPEVRVNGIAPGVVAWPDEVAVDERQAYERRIPLRRSGTPEDAAAMVRWLILEAGYVTGQMLRLDGGRWLT